MSGVPNHDPAPGTHPDRETDSPLLRVDDLRVALRSANGVAHPVRGMSLRLEPCQTLAIVGESGSGKSLTSLAVMNLLPAQAWIDGGNIHFGGRDLAGLDQAEWTRLRGEEVAMVFQDPLRALNPSLTVGYQIAEMFRRHRGAPRQQARTRAVELMEDVGIAESASRFDAYPHELSGGMRQRVVIAMALALEPRLLIADEPTTALDVTVQAQILRLLRTRQDQGQAMIIISHDLGVVARTAESVVVMYAGTAVEAGPVADVYGTPAHPYTRGLLSATPGTQGDTRVRPIRGHPPDPANLPTGCAFHPRCPLAQDICTKQDPEPRFVRPGHASACHFAEEVLTDGRESDPVDAS